MKNSEQHLLKTGLKTILFIIIILIILSKPQEETLINAYFCPNCTNIYLNYLNNATKISCALFELNDPNIENILNKKNAKIIIDNDNLNNRNYSTDRKSSYMHNKFCILDNKTVITGSTNPTINGLTKNNNNIIIIKSKQIAKIYLQEFNEILKKEQEKTTNNIDKKIKIFFCPEDNCAKQIQTELQNAKKSIYFMTFSFTHELLAQIILNKNVEKKGIIEKRMINIKSSQYKLLKNFTKIDTNPNTMHHKVFIIDNKTVITGSMNPTNNGNEHNDENILIIKDKEITKAFLEEFDKLFRESKFS